MSIRRTETIAGILVAEDWRLPWYAYQYDKMTKVCVTGEIGAVRWELTKWAYRLAMQRDLKMTLDAMARRVGVEYSDSSTTRDDSNPQQP